MTEAECVAADDPGSMLLHLRRGKVSDRKLRLFAVACCRRIWPSLEDARSRRAVEIAERYAEGDCNGEEMYSAWSNSWTAQGEGARYIHRAAAKAASAASTWYVDPDDLYQFLETGAAKAEDQFDKAMDAARQQAQQAAAWSAAIGVLNPAVSAAATQTEEQNQAELLHDIIGNPFRQVSIPADWLTPTVLALAQTAYNNRNLPAGTLDEVCLAVLADALEDAGCTELPILDHLRSPGTHVRGCWLLDRLLGKS